MYIMTEFFTVSWNLFFAFFLRETYNRFSHFMSVFKSQKSDENTLSQLISLYYWNSWWYYQKAPFATTENNGYVEMHLIYEMCLHLSEVW